MPPVFPPDDTAYDRVPPTTFSRLLFDRDVVAAVANYHMVNGRCLSSDLARESAIATRSGTLFPVTVLPGFGLQADDARMTTPDIVAPNGAVHAIDAVMNPPGAL